MNAAVVPPAPRFLGGDDAAHGACAALRTALSALQRLLAPVLPFAAEEAWSWWNDGSVHISPWPEPVGSAGDATLLDPGLEVLALVRRAKTEAKASQRTKVAVARVRAPAEHHPAIRTVLADLREAGSIVELELSEADRVDCDVELVAET